MKSVLIAALDHGWGIGHDGELPWSIPEELQLFKELTDGHALLMGRRTVDGLRSLLPNRMIFVLTSDPYYSFEGERPDGARIVPVQSYDEAEARLKLYTKQCGNERYFIAGGRSVYEQALRQGCDRYRLSLIHARFRTDTTFPVLNPDAFSMLSNSYHVGEPPFSHYLFEHTTPERLGSAAVSNFLRSIPNETS